jgi:hypothetical protein
VGLGPVQKGKYCQIVLKLSGSTDEKVREQAADALGSLQASAHGEAERALVEPPAIHANVLDTVIDLWERDRTIPGRELYIVTKNLRGRLPQEMSASLQRWADEDARHEAARQGRPA